MAGVEDLVDLTGGDNFVLPTEDLHPSFIPYLIEFYNCQHYVSVRFIWEVIFYAKQPDLRVGRKVRPVRIETVRKTYPKVVPPAYVSAEHDRQRIISILRRDRSFYRPNVKLAMKVFCRGHMGSLRYTDVKNYTYNDGRFAEIEMDTVTIRTDEDPLDIDIDDMPPIRGLPELEDVADNDANPNHDDAEQNSQAQKLMPVNGMEIDDDLMRLVATVEVDVNDFEQVHDPMQVDPLQVPYGIPEDYSSDDTVEYEAPDEIMNLCDLTEELVVLNEDHLSILRDDLDIYGPSGSGANDE